MLGCSRLFLLSSTRQYAVWAMMEQYRDVKCTDLPPSRGINKFTVFNRQFLNAATRALRWLWV